LFPGRASETEADIEEERRIFYVAITRAKRQLFLFSCGRRTMWGKSTYQMPSRFLAEIPKEMVIVEGRGAGQSDSHAGGYSSLEQRRVRASAYGGELRKGMGKHANIILTPVRQFGQDEAKSVASSSEGSYRLGDRVYHDAFGEGEVRGVRSVRGKQMIDVHFATGKVSTFFAANAVLEKLARD
jgi:DNA helicase-2/ATP-dependent DNA helicase PcrA